MKKNFISNYVQESFEELTKVTWPTKNQAVRLTIIVLGFCIAMGVFLGAIDYGLGELHTYVISHF